MPSGVLRFDEAQHVYDIDGLELLGVTHTLDAAGLIDSTWFTDESRIRGTYVHAAIVLHHEGDLDVDTLDPVLTPYVHAYFAFLRDTGFQIDAYEDRVFSEPLRCAGTLDLRGPFPRDRRFVTNVIDIKTGVVPDHVGYQTAGYAMLLPSTLPPVHNRWVLNLRADGTYRLHPLTRVTDEAVFRAALTLAHAKRGWLR